jgi:plastocyanin
MASRTKLVAAAVTALAAAALAGPAAAATPRLVATVGPDDSITLRKSSGARVSSLRAGVYRIVVRDRASDHNFRLAGRGVRKSTSVRGTGTTVWRVKLSRGTYRFVCNPHSDDMHGSFRVR